MILSAWLYYMTLDGARLLELHSSVSVASGMSYASLTTLAYIACLLCFFLVFFLLSIYCYVLHIFISRFMLSLLTHSEDTFANV